MNEEKKKINKKSLNYFQTSDIVVKFIIEKIFSNIWAELNKKKLNSLINNTCVSYSLKELNTAVEQLFINRDIDQINKNNPQIFYDNYCIDNEPINECKVIQPKSTVLDRWKIFQIPIVKKNDFNSNRIEEKSFIDERNNKKKKTIKYKPFKRFKLLKEKKEEEENFKISKNKIIDLPSYPIEDLEKKEKNKFIMNWDENKIKSNISDISNILDYQELNQYYLHKLALEEEKRQKEVNKKLNYMNSIKSIKEPKKIYENYKGKNINIDHNGEIVLIKEIKIENLQDDFLGLSTKLNNKRNKKISNELIKIPTINIEKNKKENNKDFPKNYIDINNQEGKGKIIAGSSFNRIYPEVGVNIKEGDQEKSGGNDFYKKYNKYDINKFNNTMMNIYKESYYKTRNFNNLTRDYNNINNNSNNGSNISNINEDNSNINNHSLSKTIYKSISLPDIKLNNKKINLKNEDTSFIYKSSFINKSLFNNNNNEKNSIISGDKNSGLYFDSYLIQNDIENNYQKYGKYIKVSESLKKIILNQEDNNEIIDNYMNKTKDLSNKKNNIEIFNYRNKNKLNYINDFNKTILGDKNWGNYSLINNNSFNNSQGWSRKRFNHKLFKKNNLYSTMRLREKKTIEKNTSQYFNISNPKSDFDEKKFILKYLNKTKDT